MRLAFCLAIGLWASVAAAQTSEDALEPAWTHWRAASWYLRTDNADVAALELESFREKWQALGAAAPAGIAGLAETASVAFSTNDTVTANRTLGAIGDTLAEARRQAGQRGFPEAMRRYRDDLEGLASRMRMSEQRGSDRPLDPALKADVRRAAVVVGETAAALAPAVPARWKDDSQLRTLLAQNVDGIAGLIQAIDRSQQPLATGLEIAGLISVARANYNLLFLNYGY